MIVLSFVLVFFFSFLFFACVCVFFGVGGLTRNVFL